MDTDTPTIDHADEAILASWNEIRAGSDESAESSPAADAAEPSTTEEKAPTERARTPDGKFAKADTPDAKHTGTVDTPSAEQTGVEPVVAPAETPGLLSTPVVDSPRSMPKELADKHWANLPPEVKAWTQKRDQDYEAGINRYRERADGYDRMDAAFAPYRQTLEAARATPEQAISTLLGMDAVLRRGQPEAKAALLVQLANQFNVPLEHLPMVGPLQQQLLAQTQRANALESQQTQAQEQQARRDLDTLTSDVIKFGEGKEHFAAVQSEIFALLPQVAQQMPNATPVEKLQRAYDIAIYANPTVRARIDAQQREAARQDALKKAADAKRAAAVNRTPRGVVSSVAAPTSMEETIRATAEKLGMV